MPRCPDCDFTSPELGAPCPHHPHRRTAEEAHYDQHPDAPLLGALVHDRFAAVRVAGVGGMGWVYDARDENAGGRRVALKILKASHSDDDVVRERFNREARILGMLDHPNLVDLYDSGEIPDTGQLYMAMEYVEGRTLGAVLERPRFFGARRLLNVSRGIAAGLAAAHARGVVHRDLKPANVLLVKDKGHEIPRLVDFGIARFDEALRHLTQTGMVFGTPSYMSPEQALGETGVGPAADIYAYGIMLFRMLSGELPFHHRLSLQILMAHVNKPVPELTLRPEIADDIPEALITLMHRCLEKKPEDRLPDGEALEMALGRIEAELQGVLDGPTLDPESLDVAAYAVADEPTEIVASPRPQPVAARVDDGATLVGGMLPAHVQAGDTDNDLSEDTSEDLLNVDNRQTVVSEAIPNDLFANVPKSSASPLREDTVFTGTRLALLAGAILLVVVVVLVVAFSGGDERSGSSSPLEEETQAPPPPEGPQASALPESIVRKVENLRALRTSRDNPTGMPGQAPEDRLEEINKEIERLIRDIEKEGFGVSFSPNNPADILVFPLNPSGG